MKRSRKYAPPPLPDRMLPRLDLLERIAALRWSPLRALLVVAGTGYGKTTLVADACARAGGTVAWIALDPEDQDLDAFLGGILHAIRRALPGFVTSAGELIRQEDDRIAAIMQATLVLIEDLEEQLEGPLTLVLDDYHQVNTPAINRIVSRFIKYLSPSVRLVLVSRTIPGLEVGHMRAKGEIATLGEVELQLSEAEVGELLEDVPSELRASLYERTEGWIASLLLYQEALARSPDRAPRHWTEFLEAYFGQEVLSPHPPGIQAFLLRASLLERIDPAECEDCPGLEDAAAIIAYLRENRVFVLEHEDGGLRLHPLFREFLQARLRQSTSAAEYRGLVRAIASAQWKAGRPMPALDLWLEAGLVDDAVAAVEGLAAEAAATRRVSPLEGALARVPEDRLSPTLCLVYGDLLRQWGEFDRAMPLLERARQAFVREGDSRREGRALTLLAACWGMRGQLDAMREALVQALRVLGEGDPATLAMARNLQGNACLLSAENVEAGIDHFEASLALARAAGDRYGEARALHNLGVAHTKLGNFARAMARYEEGLALSALSGGIPHFWMTPINRCLLLLYLGRPEAARADAQGLVEQTRHLRYSHEEGHALRALAQANVRLGRFDEAEEALRMAEAIVERLGDRGGRANTYHLRSYLAFSQGRLEAALALEDRALEAAGALELEARHLEFVQFKARILTALGELDEAGGLLDRIFEWLATLPYRFQRVEACLTAADLHRQRGEEAMASEREMQAEAISREQGYELSALRDRAPAGTASLPEGAAPILQLRFFGGFMATCDGRVIGARDWQSAKAKWLLAYLIEQPMGTTKAHLLEALFDDEATDASVTMTVTRLRKALEPHLAPKAPSAYVLFQGGRYVFNALSSYGADTREFIRRLEAATPGSPGEASQLVAALALYTGDFLPEFADPWVEGRRQFYRDRAIGASKRVFDLYRAAGDAGLATEVARRGLDIDPCDEDLHRRLILLYLEGKQPQRAREQFRWCAEALAKEVGVEPSEELRALVSGLGLT